MSLKNIMRALIITLCLLLGSLGFAANQYLPGSSLSLQTQINNAAASGTSLVIPGGTYTVSGLTCANGLVLESDGPVTFNIGSGNGLAIPVGCAMTLRGDFTIAGSAPSYTGYGTGPSKYGQYGITVSNASDLKIEGKVKIRNINGACFDAQGTLNWQNVADITGLSVTNCYFGIWLHNGAEYMSFAGVNAYNNVIGIQDDGANNRFANTNAIYNSIGVKLCGSNDSYCNNIGNNGHGILTGIHSNHNTYNLVVANIPALGYTISASHFIGDQSGGNAGIITVSNSKGINIAGGQIGSTISVDATSQLMVQSSYIRTDLPGYAPPSVAPGGVFFGKDNFGPTGMWSSNN